MLGGLRFRSGRTRSLGVKIGKGWSLFFKPCRVLPPMGLPHRRQSFAIRTHAASRVPAPNHWSPSATNGWGRVLWLVAFFLIAKRGLQRHKAAAGHLSTGFESHPQLSGTPALVATDSSRVYYAAKVSKLAFVPVQMSEQVLAAGSSRNKSQGSP